MPAHIVLSEPPAPVGAVAADRPLRLRYLGVNEGQQPSTGHWDHVAIVDRTGAVQYEDWHREGPLAPGATYEAFVDVGIALDRGSYVVRVTLDGGGQAPVRQAEPLTVGPARSRVAPLFRLYYTATLQPVL